MDCLAMNAVPRIKAVKWILRQLDMGVGRTQDAEVQAELVQEKIKYQRELKDLESAPKQAEFFSVVTHHSEDDEPGLKVAED
jgi:hypothetical protein